MQDKQSKTNTHFLISLIKSAFRIVGCAALCVNSYLLGGILFLIAEILGILEEIL